MSSLPQRNCKLLIGVLAVALLAASGAMAQDAEVRVVTIKASGTPTGSPQIDSALSDLPGIDRICARFAKCEHENTAKKKVKWDSTTSIGSPSSRVEVIVEAPTQADGESFFKLALIAYRDGKACAKSKASAGSRAVATVSCGAAKGSNVEYLQFVTARAL